MPAEPPASGATSTWAGGFRVGECAARTATPDGAKQHGGLLARVVNGVSGAQHPRWRVQHEHTQIHRDPQHRPDRRILLGPAEPRGDRSRHRRSTLRRASVLLAPQQPAGDRRSRRRWHDRGPAQHHQPRSAELPPRGFRQIASVVLPILLHVILRACTVSSAPLTTNESLAVKSPTGSSIYQSLWARALAKLARTLRT